MKWITSKKDNSEELYQLTEKLDDTVLNKFEDMHGYRIELQYLDDDLGDVRFISNEELAEMKRDLKKTLTRLQEEKK